jgi:putative methyltransferase (TIGR04325 family)
MPSRPSDTIGIVDTTEPVLNKPGRTLTTRLKRLVPPLIVDWLKPAWQTIRHGAPEWQYLPDGWSTPRAKGQGWADPTIPKTQHAKWAEFLRATQGTGPLGVAHEAPSLQNEDYEAHHLLMAYAYVLALAAQKKDRIALLDWGGGIGHYFIFSCCLLPDLDIEYVCKDLSLLCQAGREVLPKVRFIEEDEEVATRGYDLVLASGSLQYSEDWRSVARLIASCATPYLYVTRLPIVRSVKSFVALQMVYAYRYETENMGWFHNREEFLQHFASLEMELVREFCFGKHLIVRHAPEQAEIQGFLFKAKR